jgi:hypothetical protein
MPPGTPVTIANARSVDNVRPNPRKAATVNPNREPNVRAQLPAKVAGRHSPAGSEGLVVIR